MPGEPSLKPAEAPEPAPKGRLEQALDLITDEAVETLEKGRNPRAYQRTEKLLAIARAIRAECATRVEDFLEDGLGDGTSQVAYRGGGAIVTGNNLTIGGPRANADMDREEKLSQLEAVAARRRRDEAETRLTLVREFKELSELDLDGQPDEIKAGIEARLAEITDKLRTKDPVVEEDEPEQESA